MIWRGSEVSTRLPNTDLDPLQTKWESTVLVNGEWWLVRSNEFASNGSWPWKILELVQLRPSLAAWRNTNYLIIQLTCIVCPVRFPTHPWIAGFGDNTNLTQRYVWSYFLPDKTDAGWTSGSTVEATTISIPQDDKTKSCMALMIIRCCNKVQSNRRGD